MLIGIEHCTIYIFVLIYLLSDFLFPEVRNDCIRVLNRLNVDALEASGVELKFSGVVELDVGVHG